MIVILVFYLLASFLLGWTMVKRWFANLPTVLSVTAGFLLGIGISVPGVYFSSVLFANTNEPIVWGTLVTSVVAAVVSYRFRSTERRAHIPVQDIVLVLFSVTFGVWLMTKTFHGGTSGELFVGSNNVFDFGHALGIIRSFSWGSGIPFMSPFFAGYPMFYHFLFSFWVAMWEYFGVPIVWAMNLPSALSFASLLIVLYYVPQVVFKQKPLVGWIAVALTITNGSMTFWKLLLERGLSGETLRSLWLLPTYPFAGPFDGSTISIFVTLNSYVNQRHLVFATAFGLFLVLVVMRDTQKNALTIKRSILFGALTGLLLLWNMLTYLLISFTITGIMLVAKKWRLLVPYVFTALLTGFLFLLPFIRYILDAVSLLNRLLSAQGPRAVAAKWTIGDYLWQNLGLLPLAATLGYVRVSTSLRRYMLPCVVLFFLLVTYATLGSRGFEQKTYSFVILWINMLAAIAVGWLWDGRKTLAALVFFVLIVSGVVDLMPIKNEFAYPLVGKETAPLVSWIRDQTPKDSVFVSYADMIDPVAIAGRRNYFGFFKNLGFGQDRSTTVASVYSGDAPLAKAKGISYVLVPKWQKNDFPYTVDMEKLEKAMPLIYEDDRYAVFTVK